MRLTRSKLIAASAAMAAVFAAVTIAEARPRAKHVAQGRPLTVQGRSFLDPGKVVPVGRESSYVHAGHTFGRTPDFYAQPSRYGMETLPGRFDFPRQPLFNF